MPAACETLSHVRDHSAEPNHSELHIFSLLVLLPIGY
jgi:hypothetical protein